MYGTIAKLTFQPGAAEKARRDMMKAYESVKIPGFVSSHVYVTDANPNVCYLAVLFDSKEAYWANARDPQQDVRYREMRALLATDPEWNDGEVVQSFSQ